MRALNVTAGVLLVGLLASAAQAEQRIGVIRIVEVFTKIGESRQIAQADAARKRDAETERERRYNEIRLLQGQLAQYRRGTAQSKEAILKLQDMQDDFETWLKRTERSLAVASKEDYQKMYDHIREATKQVAAKRQLTLVVNDTAADLNPADQLTADQFESALAQRPIVFSDESIDITQEVITRVDANLAGKPDAPK